MFLSVYVRGLIYRNTAFGLWNRKGLRELVDIIGALDALVVELVESRTFGADTSVFVNTLALAFVEFRHGSSTVLVAGESESALAQASASANGSASVVGAVLTKVAAAIEMIKKSFVVVWIC
jgi:hypothetical protein